MKIKFTRRNRRTEKLYVEERILIRMREKELEKQ